MGYLESLPNGWLLYCGICNKFIKQSDPQSTSLGKTVIVDENGSECEACKADAQAILGRLGLPPHKEEFLG